MAEMLDVLLDAIDDKAVAALGRAVDLDPGQVAAVVREALPVIVERLQSNASGGDADGIAAAAADHDGAVLTDAVGFLGGGFRSGPGMGILGHVFGDQLDTAVASVAATTGVPQPVVGLVFQALAPMAMAAITKAVIGAVTAGAVVALLGVAVAQIRSGRLQRALGRLNDRFDDDGDGNAVDDIARDAGRTAQRLGGAVGSGIGRVARSKRTKKAVDAGRTGARKAAKKLGGRLGRLWRR